MLNRIVKIFGGDPIKKEINRLSDDVGAINALEAEYEKLSCVAVGCHECCSLATAIAAISRSFGPICVPPRARSLRMQP